MHFLRQRTHTLNGIEVFCHADAKRRRQRERRANDMCGDDDDTKRFYILLLIRAFNT